SPVVPDHRSAAPSREPAAGARGRPVPARGRPAAGPMCPAAEPTAPAQAGPPGPATAAAGPVRPAAAGPAAPAPATADPAAGSGPHQARTCTSPPGSSTDQNDADPTPGMTARCLVMLWSTAPTQVSPTTHSGYRSPVWKPRWWRVSNLQRSPPPEVPRIGAGAEAERLDHRHRLGEAVRERRGGVGVAAEADRTPALLAPPLRHPRPQ